MQTTKIKKLHYVDITWDTVIRYLNPVMESKWCPMHSIELQLPQAAIQTKNFGVERLIIGESVDLIFEI